MREAENSMWNQSLFRSSRRWYYKTKKIKHRNRICISRSKDLSLSLSLCIHIGTHGNGAVLWTPWHFQMGVDNPDSQLLQKERMDRQHKLIAEACMMILRDRSQGVEVWKRDPASLQCSMECPTHHCFPMLGALFLLPLLGWWCKFTTASLQSFSSVPDP